MPEMVRIQKLLSSWGVASRRTIEKWIDEGRIKVNGATLSEQGLLLNPEADLRIEVDGKQIKRPAAAEFAIYCFNKPAGVVTTLDDELGRKTIKDYLPKDRRLYPIGRLDYDSTGLLLVTDHGELTHRLLHPSFKVEKEYIVRIKSQALSGDEQKRFSSGLDLEDGKTAPCIITRQNEPLTYSVIIREGRKRQVKRMFACLDRKVTSLHRTRFGPIRLGSLRPGEIRILDAKEKAELLLAVGLS